MKPYVLMPLQTGFADYGLVPQPQVLCISSIHRACSNAPL